MTARTAEAAYYDQYWSNRSQRLNAHEVARLGEIWATLALLGSDCLKRTDIKVCDLGCGSGWLANELNKIGAVTGVDLSPSGIALARTRWPAVAEFVATDILSWDTMKTFDLIVSSEVLEHIDDKRALVEKVASLLKPGGYVLLTTPNLRLKRSWDAGKHGAQFHELWASPKELRTLCATRFETLRHTTFLFDVLYTGMFRYTSAPKLLQLLRAAGVLALYDGVRATLGLGLYQVYLGRLR